MNSKLHIIIFSLDRACQLDTLLTSIYKYLNFDLTVDILYNTSNSDFEAAYQTLTLRLKKIIDCESHHESYVNKFTNPLISCNIRNIYRWLKYAQIRKAKTDFRQSLIEIIRESDSENIMFLVDDAAFYTEVQDPSGSLQVLELSPESNTFSLLLAGDWLYKPKFISYESEYYIWDYYDRGSIKEWNYPFSVVGTIYNREYLLYVIKKIAFANPNTFESFVCDYVKRKKIFRFGHCGVKSCLQVIHLNRVQMVNENKSYGITPQKLNEYYLNGYQLHYIIDKSLPRHYESKPSSSYLLRGGHQVVLDISGNLFS